jgi:hypothetical protein
MPPRKLLGDMVSNENATMKNSPDESETLRLITAFLNVADPEARLMILAIAEATASGATITDTVEKLLVHKEKQR